MKKFFTTLVVIFIIIIAIVIAGPLFVVNEGEQVVIVQLGRITNVITDAGLHFKVPFIDEVVRYPKKIMAWNGEANIIPTAERQFIYVDVVARWRISDPKVYYESINTVNAAYSKLSEIIDSAVRTVVAENPLIESVRNSNSIIERGTSTDDLGLGEGIEVEIITTTTQANSSHDPIVRGRRQLAELILARSRQNMEREFGITLIDVVTRQISYSPELTPSVHARMIRERNQLAMLYRSDGEGRKAEWMGRMDRDRREVISAAYSQSQTIMGTADAEAARIYADAYNRDASTRNFYDYWRSIESYRQTMPKFNKTLTTDMDYFRFLYNPR
ncbi:MAG: protease modulator HflC [Treponema sp.]|jgi:membrane protease subunit HflC|nr:protease modulator HflC [Treponema sp.]